MPPAACISRHSKDVLWVWVWGGVLRRVWTQHHKHRELQAAVGHRRMTRAGCGLSCMVSSVLLFISSLIKLQQ